MRICDCEFKKFLTLALAVAAISVSAAESGWIAGETQVPETEAEFFQHRRNAIVGRDIVVREGLKSAKLRIAALGFYDLFVNGELLTSTAISSWTPYRRHIAVDAFDVTAKLKSGKNRVEIELGNGWRNPLPFKMWKNLNLRQHLAVGEPCVRVRLVLEYADGKNEQVVSGPDWSAARGSVVRNSVYTGETRDLRLVDRVWSPVRIVAGEAGALVDRLEPPVTVRVVHPAAKVTRTGDRWLLDFGANYTGVVRAKLRGLSSGDVVSFRCGEALAGGKFSARTGCCGQIESAEQCDVVIAADGAEFTFTPRFTFHAFRYVEVSGLREAPREGDFELLEQSSAVVENGEFSCSDTRLNAIAAMCRRTFLNNIMSVQSDCPAREKFGYGADAAACAEAFVNRFDMRGFYAKTVRDNLDEAAVDGWFTETSPYVGISSCGYGGRSGPIGWSLGVPVLADLLWRYYGDRETLASAYPAMARYAKLVAAKFPDDAIPNCIGDHLALDKCDPAMSAQAVWVAYLDHLALSARLLGRETESAEWCRLADKARQAFIARHVHGAQVGDRLTQGGQLFALRFNLVPDRKRAYELLKQAIAERGNALSTGLQTTNFLLEELSEHGDAELASALVLNERGPSWMNMLLNGATTMWESWVDPTPINHSHDHPMYGHVDAWLKRWVLGVRVTRDAFGGDLVVIDPHAVAGLKWAKGSVSTAKGMVSVAWTRRPDGSIDVKFTLPPGCKRVDP